MRQTDAMAYLPQMGLNPLMMVTCASPECSNAFMLAQGFAVEARVGENLSIAFFCEDACYLRVVPTHCCGRA